MTEYQKRLNDIKKGPWSEKSADVRKFIQLKDTNKKILTSDKIVISDILGKPELEKRLKRLLAPHWLKSFNEEQLLLRDSFDEALTFLKILELGLRTEYLELETTRPVARKEILQLLWSKPARDYLTYYDYFDVLFLSKRVGIDLGFKRKIKIPKSSKSQEINFAVFLSQLNALYDDENIDNFFGIMDGYTYDDIDAFLFYEFLTDGQKYEYTLEEIDNFIALYSGIQNFVFQLDDFFKDLTNKEKIQYGTFFAYWLGKFFGYDFGKNGFFKSNKLFDWSIKAYVNVFLNYEFAFLNTDKEINQEIRHKLFVSVNNLKKVWEIIKQNLEEMI